MSLRILEGLLSIVCGMDWKVSCSKVSRPVRGCWSGSETTVVCWKEVDESRRYLEGLLDRTRWLIGYGKWGGEEEGTKQASGMTTWTKSSPLRRWGTLGRETGRKEGRSAVFCLGYIHFGFLLAEKVHRLLGIRVCSSRERLKLKTQLTYKWWLDTREWIRTHRPVFLKLQILIPISELWNQYSGTSPALKTKKR